MDDESLTQTMSIMNSTGVERVLSPSGPSMITSHLPTLPPVLSAAAAQKQRVDLACNNCGTRTTTIWRRDANGSYFFIRYFNSLSRYEFQYFIYTYMYLENRQYLCNK